MKQFWSRVEAKVKTGTLATLIASVVLAVLNATLANSQIMGGFPAWLQFVLITFGPSTATFLAAFNTKHTAIAPVTTTKP